MNRFTLALALFATAALGAHAQTTSMDDFARLSGFTEGLDSGFPRLPSGRVQTQFPDTSPLIFSNPDAIPMPQGPRDIEVIVSATRAEARRSFLARPNYSFRPRKNFVVFSTLREFDSGVRAQLNSGADGTLLGGPTLSPEVFARQTGIYTSSELKFRSFRSAGQLGQALALSRAAREVFIGLAINGPRANGITAMLSLLQGIRSRLGAGSAGGRLQSLIDLMQTRIADATQEPEGQAAALVSLWPSLSAELMVQTLGLLRESGTIPAR